MRILVCGGRDYSDALWVAHILGRVLRERGISLVIHGAGRGADSLAASWAGQHRIETLPFPADWKAYGRGAGPIRNQQMLDEGKPDAVVAFPGGKGTADMVERAKKAGVPVWEPGAFR